MVRRLGLGVAIGVVASFTIVTPRLVHAAFTGKVDTGGPALNVYVQPTPSSPVRGTIANGSSISLQCGVTSVAASGKYGSSTLWHEVIFSNQIGWVSDSNVFTGTSSLPSGEPWCAKGTVRTSSGGALEVRSAPSTSASVIGSVGFNTQQLLYCGANGSTASGPWGSSTLWHQIGIGSTVGWVPDASMLTNFSSLPPGEIWCPSVPTNPSTPIDKYPVSGVFKTARDRNGVANVGGSTNAVHRWGAGNVQDFDGGAWGWNIIMQADSSTAAAYSLRTGFWDWYKKNNNQGMSILGYPKSDEFVCGSASARQFFEKGQIWYNSSYPIPAYQVTPISSYVNSVAFKQYKANGRNVVEVLKYACSFVGSAKLPDNQDAAGKGNCVNAVWQMFTYGLGYTVDGNGWTFSWDIWNGIGSDYVGGVQMRWPRTNTDAMLNPPAGTVALFKKNLGHAVLVLGGKSPDGSAYVMSTDVNGGWGISTISNYVTTFGASNYLGAVRFAG